MPERKRVEGSEQEGNSYTAPVEGFSTANGEQNVGVSYIGTSEDETVDGSGLDDVLIGEDGSDTLNGLGGKDLLAGGEGADKLDGGAGDDRLNGNAGDDTLTGGSGDDTFYFNGTFGDDTITDFSDGDNIDLTKFSHITSMDDLTITMVDGNAVITISKPVEEPDGTTTVQEYGSITLEGVDSSSLSAEDFNFYTPITDNVLEQFESPDDANILAI